MEKVRTRGSFHCFASRSVRSLFSERQAVAIENTAQRLQIAAEYAIGFAGPARCNLRPVLKIVPWMQNYLHSIIEAFQDFSL